MASNKFTRIQLRRGTKDELKTINPLLREGEPLVESDTGKIKIGDGKKHWNELIYSNEVPSRITDFKQGNISGYYITTDNEIEISNDENNTNIIPDGVIIDTISFSYSVTAIPLDAYIKFPDGSTINIFKQVSENYNGTISIELEDKKISSDTEIQFVIKSKDGAEFYQTMEFKFGYYLYYGYSTNENILDTGFIGTDGLPNESNSRLVASRNSAYNIIQGDNSDAYIYFFLPDEIYNKKSSLGIINPIFTDASSGFSGGFISIADNIVIRNKYGKESSYKQYRSAHKNLGDITIVIS